MFNLPHMTLSCEFIPIIILIFDNTMATITSVQELGLAIYAGKS